MRRLFDPFPVHLHQPMHDVALLLLRLVFGGVMVYAHGWGKLTGFAERAAKFADPLGVGSEASLALAVFAEVFCAAALVAGLLTRWVLVPLGVTMVVAVFVVHADDPFGRKELGLVYLAAYVALFLTGPGRWSVDAWLSQRLAR